MQPPQDAKRRFLEAALRYYELSQPNMMDISGRHVDEAELTQVTLVDIC